MELQPAVVVIEPERMNILGLILASLLGRQVARPAARRHARALRGDVGLEASGMEVTLRFAPGRIEIRRGAPGRPRVRIRGSLTAFLDAALGRRRARHVLSGRLRARGGPIRLWRVLALVRA